MTLIYARILEALSQLFHKPIGKYPFLGFSIGNSDSEKVE